MIRFLRRKFKILKLYYWYVFSVKKNRQHWDLDLTNRLRYGWESDTTCMHIKLHKKFNLCVRIFGNEYNSNKR